MSEYQDYVCSGGSSVVTTVERMETVQNRRTILKALISGTEDGGVIARAVVAHAPSNSSMETETYRTNHVQGYAVMSYRQDNGDMAFGPVVADTPNVALEMLTKLLSLHMASRSGSGECSETDLGIEVCTLGSVSMWLTGQNVASSCVPHLRQLGFEHKVTFTLIEWHKEEDCAVGISKPLAENYVCCASPSWG
jgi:hypothetical protein